MESKPINVAIIPARSGSKRLPGKNIKLLGDKPLIAWTIEAAIQSECFDRVIVSTDEQRIADIAKKCGAEVPFLRPAELSSDIATTDAVISHVIDWLELHERAHVGIIGLLQPTSPFRNSRHIKESFALMRAKEAEGVVSVTRSEVKFELCNILPEDLSLARFISIDNIQHKKRTQDMKQIYELNGAIYLFKRNIVGEITKLYKPTSKAYAYIMEPDTSVDIDTINDFMWAEFMYSRLKNKSI